MNISVIGAGRIGILLEDDAFRYKPCTHIGSIVHFAKIKKNASKGPANLISVCDLDRKKLAYSYDYYFKRTGQSIQTTTNYREVISQNPDILVIATNTNSHFAIAAESIKAGIPRLVLEKPVCLDRREADKLANLALKKNTRIWANYERRYHNKYRGLKTLVQSGQKYGKLIHYRGWFASSNPSIYASGEKNEGALLHDTTHLLDLAQFICGKISESSSRIVETVTKSRIHCLALSHENNLAGEIWTTTSNPFFHFEIELMFEKGRITAGNGFYREENSRRSKLYKGFISLGEPVNKPDKKIKINENPFIRLYDDVIHDRYDASFFHDACDNVRILSR